MLIEVSTASPGTHAFVMGVSHYPFADGPHSTSRGEESGLANLTSSARSAAEVAAWLLNEFWNPDAPLASITLLLSPSPGELLHPVVLARMAGQTAPATRKAVQREFIAFRDRCRSDVDNLAFVYVVGHGVQLDKRGAIVLLEDFAIDDEDDVLFGAIDVVACHDAMDDDDMAARQIWFSDACRQRPAVARRYNSLGGAYRPYNEPLGRTVASPLFLSASTREEAFAEVGGVSIFCQALLAALRGASARERDWDCADWHVCSNNLSATLPDRVEKLMGTNPGQQAVDLAGRSLNVVLQRLRSPPDADVRIELSPADRSPQPAAELLFRGSIPQEIGPRWPLEFRGPAGLYLLNVESGALSGRVQREVLDVQPPDCTMVVEVP